MIEKFFALLERLVIAQEKIAGNAPLPNKSEVAKPGVGSAAKAKPGRPPKATTPPPADTDEGGLGDDEPLADEPDSGLGDEDDAGGLGDDEPAAEEEVTVTKEMMREAMTAYQAKTSGEKARELLKAHTSTKSVAFNTVKPAEYAKVRTAALAALKKLK